MYHISFTANDDVGGACGGDVQVGVPHDKKDTPIDDGALYDSTIELRRSSQTNRGRPGSSPADFLVLACQSPVPTIEKRGLPGVPGSFQGRAPPTLEWTPGPFGAARWLRLGSSRMVLVPIELSGDAVGLSGGPITNSGCWGPEPGGTKGGSRRIAGLVRSHRDTFTHGD